MWCKEGFPKYCEHFFVMYHHEIPNDFCSIVASTLTN